MEENKSQIIIYQTENGKTKLSLLGKVYFLFSQNSNDKNLTAK
jgi:hypothetical protein